MGIIQNFYDVQKFLQRFGIVIYTGDRELDKRIMLDECKELFQMHLIDKETYMQIWKVMHKEEY